MAYRNLLNLKRQAKAGSISENLFDASVTAKLNRQPEHVIHAARKPLKTEIAAIPADATLVRGDGDINYGTMWVDTSGDKAEIYKYIGTTDRKWLHTSFDVNDAGDLVTKNEADLSLAQSQVQGLESALDGKAGKSTSNTFTQVNTFNAGIAMGGNTVNDVIVSADSVQTLADSSDSALTSEKFVIKAINAGIAAQDFSAFAQDNAVVKLSGDQTIGGVKSFTDGISLGGHAISDVKVNADTVQNLANASDTSLTSEKFVIKAIDASISAQDFSAFAQDNAVVKLTGNQSITGLKTFTVGIALGGHSASDIAVGADTVRDFASSSDAILASEAFVIKAINANQVSLTGYATESYVNDAITNARMQKTYTSFVAASDLSSGETYNYAQPGTAFDQWVFIGGQLISETDYSWTGGVLTVNLQMDTDDVLETKYYYFPNV